MANSIALAQKYTDVLDRIFKVGALTTDLESEIVDWSGANTVKVKKIVVPDLGTYSRETGFPVGDLQVTYESWTLTQDKGREFSLDAMDNEETLDATFTQAAELFMTEKVIPAVDTYRLNKLATSGTQTGSTEALSTGADVVAAIDAAEADAIDAEIPLNGAILYMSADAYTKLKSQAINRFASYTDETYNRVVKTFDEMKIVRVPASRLPANVDFMIVNPRVQQSVAKHATLRIFSPAENQQKDAWKFQYRIYHDTNVFSNGVRGILVHKNA